MNMILHCLLIKMTPVLCGLQIDCATEEHQGTYLCCISNVLEERWTEPVDVDVGESGLDLRRSSLFFDLECLYKKINVPTSIFTLPVPHLKVTLFPFCWRYFPIFEREVVCLWMLLGSSFTCTTGKWCKMKPVFAPFSLFHKSICWGLVFFFFNVLYFKTLMPLICGNHVLKKKKIKLFSFLSKRLVQIERLRPAALAGAFNTSSLKLLVLHVDVGGAKPTFHLNLCFSLW